MLTPAAVSTLRRAVRCALALEHRAPDAWRWKDQVPPGDFVAAVAAHRVAAVLEPALDRCAYPAAVTEAVRRQRNHARLAAMGQIHAIRAVDAQLAPLDHLFIKGAALAVRTTGDPTARGAGDIDVVVRPDDLGAATELLLDCGWSVRDGYTVDRRSWAWRHQLRTTYELGLEGTLGRLDLHWRLDPTYGALPGFDELWARHETVDIGPAAVPTLAGPDTLAHSLRHAAKDSWSSLRSLVDIARLAQVPGNWPEHLDRLDRATLTVVNATIGLPSSVPRFRSTASAIPTALRTQVRSAEEIRFPGDNAQRFARYMLASSHGPRDLVTTASMVALPPVLTATIAEQHLLPALAAAAGRRVAQALTNLRARR
ncbi:MAG TPA: nucleotidyltransferase family protein [Nocardioides sp.]|nr:nucleotidyltransferase family protein [Nocardioides sp.]